MSAPEKTVPSNVMLPDDEHNQRLINYVHPPHWVNPTPTGQYNLVVIGGGTAGLADPIRIPRQSEALYLLQRLRDESHRFAITFHRELRAKRMTVSVLDGIAGLGPTRKKRLTTELGGVKAVKTASLDELKALTWLPDAVAEAVHAKLHARS